MKRPLVNPRLKVATPQHWPDLCTIKRIVYVANDTNQKLPSSLTTVTGMLDIPCRLAAYIDNIVTDSEQRLNTATVLTEKRTAKLNGFFPTIDPVRQVAVVNNRVYQIRGVDADSQDFSTRLRLEIMSPNFMAKVV